MRLSSRLSRSSLPRKFDAVQIAQELAEALRAVVGDAGIVVGAALSARAASTLDSSGSRALVLARPASTEELSKIMALCHAQAQRVVVQGGMTGLVEGGTAQTGELALSLERMNTVERLDPISQTITVQSGVSIQAVQNAAEEDGLLFPVDWGARGTATVGGAIATNAGGNTVVRYGMMREQVLGLEVVLPDGTILSSMSALLKNNTGYDLKQLFIGSEGTLGIVTRAVLRLRPAMLHSQTALIAMQDFDDVVRVFAHMQSGLAGALSAFEVMWREHYHLIVTEGGHQWVLPDDYPYYAVVEASGADAEVDMDRFQTRLGEMMEAGAISDAVICTSDIKANAVWAIREDVDTFLRALHPPILFDVSVPITDMEAYVATVKAEMARALPHARGTTFGHLGDNNLHFCWTVGTDNAEEKAEVNRIVYAALEPYGGSVSAEHGIGTAKRKYLNYTRSTVEIEWMRRIKGLFDPKNILNPGRIVDSSPAAGDS